MQNQSNENGTQENPNNYAVDRVENTAEATITTAHTNTKRILRYVYRKRKLYKTMQSERPTNDNIQMQKVAKDQFATASSTTRKTSEFNSHVKTKNYYTRRHKETSTPSLYHYRNPSKAKQEERIRFSEKNTIKNKLPSTERVEIKDKLLKKPKKNPIKNMVKKQSQQAKRKAQKKILQASAKRMLKASKAIAKVSMELAFKAVQLMITSIKALVSAIVALGGGAIVLVVLIIIIVVAAIVASPFGIFISEEANEGISISAIVAECNREFTQKIELIESSNAYDHEEVQGEQADWLQVLAVFAVKTAGTDNDTAQDVVVIDETKKNLLKEVFWDMNTISSHLVQKNGETVLNIAITGKTSDDMAMLYHFTQKQKETLATLLENSTLLLSATHSLTISDTTVSDVLNKLPQTLSPERKAVVNTACSLVGKVNYFWGGKSSVIGWDNNWGKMMRVTADGSSSTGTIRPFGLDCSGFVAWTFVNAMKDAIYANTIGYGTNDQYAKCVTISWNEALPGDLVFYSDLSHVGIVAGTDVNGNMIIINCASTQNNVVLSSTDNFTKVCRPSFYN